MPSQVTRGLTQQENANEAHTLDCGCVDGRDSGKPPDAQGGSGRKQAHCLQMSIL